MMNRGLFRGPTIVLDKSIEAAPRPPKAPEQPYTSCPECKSLYLSDELSRGGGVCPVCGHHLRIGARSRINFFADPGSFWEFWPELQGGDPLKFPGYQKKLVQAQMKSGESEGVLTGECTIGGNQTCIFAMDPGFVMGSMGTVVGEKITRLFEHAAEKRLPVIGFCLSGGARMQEGALSLMQMAKTTGAVKRHSDGGGLFISVLCDPTTGGVMASFAMEGDIIIAEPKALCGFAGQRVIEQTIRQKLPEGFQKAEFLLEKGFVDLVCDRRLLRGRLAEILRMHRRGAE